MSSDSVFEVPDHVVARRIGAETVILDLESGTYFALDPVGARTWELISEGRTPTAVCDIMLSEYDVERERLEQDIERLIEDLCERGLLL